MHPGRYRNKTAEFDVSVSVNQHGFVDHPWELQSEKAVFLLVGDSFVQGAQVELEHGWGRLLEQQHKMDGSSIKIMSIGVPGAGIATEIELIKQYTPQVNPKRIYLSFLVDNDIFNNHPILESKQDKPFYQLKEDDIVLYWKQSDRWEHLPLDFHSLRWTYRNLWMKNEERRQLKVGNGVPLHLLVHNNTTRLPIWEESWLITQKAFTALQQYCKSNDIELQVVLTPSHWQISRQRREQLKEDYPAMNDWDVENYAYQRSIKMLADLGIDTIDLYPDFREYPDPNALYFTIDGHWTKEGHALAAKILYTNWKASTTEQ